MVLTTLHFNDMVIIALKHTLFQHTVQNFTEKVSIVTSVFFVVLKCLGHQFVLGFIDVLCFILFWKVKNIGLCVICKPGDLGNSLFPSVF